MNKQIKKALSCFGNSQTAMAVAINAYLKTDKCRQGHVYQWLNSIKNPSARYAIAIEKVTDGLVTAHELRPDIFGEPD